MKTYGDLLAALYELTPSQLNMTITVSAGCDANGNAEFFACDALTLAENPDIACGAENIFELDQPIILFQDSSEDY